MRAFPDHDLRLIALEAAAPDLGAAFGIEVRQIRRLPSLTRAVLALEAEDGRHVLRVHDADERRDELESLLTWLAALAESGLPVPRPRPSSQRGWLAEVEVAGLPGRQRCSLLTWLEGRALAAEAMRPCHARAMGELLARLHEYALRWQAPAGFRRPRLDGEGLFGERSPYAAGEGGRLLSNELRSLVHAVQRRTEDLLQGLRALPDAWGLLHADLIAKNCLFGQDGLRALDFDHCAWGCFLYDLAPATLEFSARPEGEALARALWTGYTTHRSLAPATQADLQVFVAARLVASCRWLVAHRHVPAVADRIETLLAQRTLALRDYLATGHVRRRSAML